MRSPRLRPGRRPPETSTSPRIRHALSLLLHEVLRSFSGSLHARLTLLLSPTASNTPRENEGAAVSPVSVEEVVLWPFRLSFLPSSVLSGAAIKIDSISQESYVPQPCVCTGEAQFGKISCLWEIAESPEGTRSI